MYILGINAYHGDSSACIYKDGHLIAAIEEERIRRVKHWAGIPIEAIKACLDEAEISIEHVDYITISRDPKAKIHKKIAFALKHRLSFSALKNRASNAMKVGGVKAAIFAELGVDPKMEKPSLINIEHHRSHMASSFFSSPFNKAAILSIDGMGDFTSSMIGVGEGNKIKVLDSISFPHSIGFFYTAITQYLGFPNYGDEYKVMGLAPLGEAKYVDGLRDILILKPEGKFELNPKYFKHFKEGVKMEWENGVPLVDDLFTIALEEKLGARRDKNTELTQYHKDLAASVQRYTEEVIFHLAEDLFKRTGLENLCICGGVGQNSVANGKVVKNTSFKRLYVPPSSHDGGTSVGSALYHYYHNLDNQYDTQAYQPIAYTGSKFTTAQIKKILDEKNIKYIQLGDDELCDLVSDCLLNSGVIGWFQGRAEFGPRALGHRSILADPRRDDARQLLNDKIKRRESFRPFAPSILKEYASEYFEQVDEVPFMEKVFKIKKEKHQEIPAVTHIDGTGRLQTVDRNVSPKYYKLIETFKEKTGTPILLNTSFNENEPIVNSPEEALACFLRTKMDMLVMEDIIIKREDNN